MPESEKKKTVGRRPRKRKTFDPEKPFAEGVRDQEVFYIQDGHVFDRTTLIQKGTPDG